MSKLFEVFIMWVLYSMGWCPFGLALAFTITMSACIFLSSVAETVKKNKENE